MLTGEGGHDDDKQFGDPVHPQRFRAEVDTIRSRCHTGNIRQSGWSHHVLQIVSEDRVQEGIRIGVDAKDWTKILDQLGFTRQVLDATRQECIRHALVLTINRIVVNSEWEREVDIRRVSDDKVEVQID